MRRTVWVLAVTVAMAGSCRPEGATECFNQVLAGAGAEAERVRADEAMRDLARADEILVDEGRRQVSGALEGGRLVVVFNGPMVSGFVPRTSVDANAVCGVGDIAAFITPDAGVATASLKVDVITRAADGGQLHQLNFTSIDAGTPLPNRTMELFEPRQ